MSGHDRPTWPLKVVSVPTNRLDGQNPLFSMLYRAAGEIGMSASDLSPGRLLRERFDAVFVHFPEHFANNYPLAEAARRSSSLLTALALARAKGARIVWVAHNSVPLELQHPRLTGAVMRAFLRLCDAVIFLSEHSRDEFLRRSPHSVRHSVVVPHPSYGHETEFDERWPPGPLTLGLIGEQKFYKQPALAVALFAALAGTPQGHGARLLVAGEIITERDAVTRALAALPPERASVEERRLSDTEVSDTIRRCHFVLLPYSHIVNSGLAMLVLACGRPVICSDLPLFRELQERFGPVWVRVLGPAGLAPLVEAPPTPEDFRRLREALNRVSLREVARAHAALVRDLRGP